MSLYDSATGYEPSSTRGGPSFRLNGSRDQWSSYRFQFLVCVSTLGDDVGDLLDHSPAEVLAARPEALGDIKTQVKGTSDEEKVHLLSLNSTLVNLPRYIAKEKKVLCRALIQSLGPKAINFIQGVEIGDPQAMWARLKVEFEGYGSAQHHQSVLSM